LSDCGPRIDICVERKVHGTGSAGYWKLQFPGMDNGAPNMKSKAICLLPEWKKVWAPLEVYIWRIGQPYNCLLAQCYKPDPDHILAETSQQIHWLWSHRSL